jgi:two-component system, sensor histidine kinase RegB
MPHNQSYLKNLKQLWWLRNIAIIGQSLTIFSVGRFLHITLPEMPLWSIIGAMVSINILTLLRIRLLQSPVSEKELFFQLMLDMGGLFLLLYFTGGASNPFTALFILQVIIAATTLSPRYTWLAAGISILLYTLLMFWNIPMPVSHHHHTGDEFNMHIHGMWVSFVLLAVLVAWFVARIHSTIRRQDQLLAEAEQIAALGMFATSAAHELGTPLSIMAVLAGDYTAETAGLFKEQIQRCKQIISQITLSAGVMRAEAGNVMLLADFLRQIVGDWQKLRPEVALNCEIPEGLPEVHIIAEYSLGQAIINILNNAADSCPSAINFSATWSASQLMLEIRDYGAGFPDAVLSNIHAPGNSTKPEGMGMGLYLTNTIISRLGGRLSLSNAGGAVVHMELPLKKLLL